MRISIVILISLFLVPFNLNAKKLYGDVTGSRKNARVAKVGEHHVDTVSQVVCDGLGATSCHCANSIVRRDCEGNFTANMITIQGEVTNPTDVATKQYVDYTTALGVDPKDPARVVATTDTILSGLSNIDSVDLNDGDRVLLVGQNIASQNGLWLASSGSWTRPADFATTLLAGRAYVLIEDGNQNVGSSWVCTTTTAQIDIDNQTFVEFNLPPATTGANVGTGAGIFKDKTGVILNLKSLTAGLHLTVTGNENEIVLATDATNLSTSNTLVVRDDQAGFAAGTINAAKLIVQNLICTQSVQVYSPVNNVDSPDTVTIDSNTSILLLTPAENILTSYLIVNFPANPTNGQSLTILLGTSFYITLINQAANGSAIFSPVLALNPGMGIVSATYLYLALTNTWYRVN